MPGTDGGGGTPDGGRPGELIPDRKASNCCVLGDGGTTITKRKQYHIISNIPHAQENKDKRCGPRVLLHTRTNKRLRLQRQTYQQTLEQTIRCTHKLVYKTSIHSHTHGSPLWLVAWIATDIKTALIVRRTAVYRIRCSTATCHPLHGTLRWPQSWV